jgi:hypothetical protein
MVWRRPGRRTVYAVIAMLAITLLVMAAPPWGSDFGAALAGAPAFGLFAWMLLGRQIRLRTVGILAAVLLLSGLLVGFADLLRPKDEQTHVGRFFGQVAGGGLGDFTLTIRRKLTENLQTLTTTKMLWVLPVLVALIVFLWRSPHGRARALYTEVLVIRQTLLALVALAALGYALNDSGAAIPALMGVVFECALVFVVLAEPDREPREKVPIPPSDDLVRERQPELV